MKNSPVLLNPVCFVKEPDGPVVHFSEFARVQVPDVVEVRFSEPVQVQDIGVVAVHFSEFFPELMPGVPVAQISVPVPAQWPDFDPIPVLPVQAFVLLVPELVPA
jgi:hypothetical protein